FETEDCREHQADDQHDACATLGRFLVDPFVEVERQVADARTEVMQIRPDQDQQNQLGQRMRRELPELLEAFGGTYARLEYRKKEDGQRKKKQGSRNTVQD